MSLLEPEGPRSVAQQRYSAETEWKYRHAESDEAAIRRATTTWGRAKWPEARVVNELVVAQGFNRADLAFISPDRLVTVEVKSKQDHCYRFIAQCCAFQAASHELWAVVAENHLPDIRRCRAMMPWFGIAAARRRETEAKKFDIEELEQPGALEPGLQEMLTLLWVAELSDECARHLVGVSGQNATHHRLVTRMIKVMSKEEITAAVCRQLRARDCGWLADPPIPVPSRRPVGQ